MAVERLLDEAGHRAVVGGVLAKPSHRLVGLLQGECLSAGNAQTLVPVMRMAVGARDHQPVQHGQVDGPLDIEAELALAQQTVQDVATAGLLPQPPEHQLGADADAAQLGQFAAVETGKHNRAAGVARGGGNQAVEEVGVLDLIAPAKRLDDALDVAATLASVLDEIEVFVGSDLLDADEHGVEPDYRQATTSNRSASSYIAIFSVRTEQL